MFLRHAEVAKGKKDNPRVDEGPVVIASGM
jgi:hypothetical protein